VTLTGVVLDPLVAADLLQSAVSGAAPEPGQPAGGWIELQSLDDVVLGV
jgi:hypothetical protein